MEENTLFYESDEEVQSIDAFVTTYPAQTFRFWLGQNKPIVFLPCHRYNFGSCTEKAWKNLNEKILQVSISSTLYSPHFSYDRCFH
jgi:hypothetical protein